MTDITATVSRWRELTTASDRTGPDVLVVSSFTAQPLAPSIGVGIADLLDRTPAIRFADYNQIFQVCLDPASHGADDADEIVVIWRIEDVFERDFHAWACRQPEATIRLLDAARALGAAIGSLAHGRSVIVSDAPTPIGDGLDHDDPELLIRLVALQARINAAFDDALAGASGDGAGHHVERLRFAALQHAAGTTNSFDRRTWLMYRQPLTAAFAHRVGDEVATLIGGRTRVPPKLIVLDCDGTLWDGVIADDGIGGLDCSDAFPGSAYRSFQRALQRLRHDGVLLALSSKNDDANVSAAFAELDGMVLTDADIATRRVSWDPKPPQVAEIVAELNLGLDAVVFVDDSDFEVGSMRTQLAAIRSLHVPGDVEALPDLLAETGWFRRMSVTDDDRQRTERMLAESDRTRASTAMSHDEFLATLGLTVRRVDVGPGEIGRVAQLVNKTNQFNLTTIRRSESDVAALLTDPGAAVFAFSVDDRFGEYGIVGVVIARLDIGWCLDTVLMSCRVLGRGVESAMLATVVSSLRRSDGAGDITGTYRATDRNALVATLLADHGFDRAPADEGGEQFVLPAGREIAVPAHITVAGP
jgi:FkbH-like protein